MSQTLLKKITISHVHGAVEAPKVGEETQLMSIIGYAKAYEMKTTAYGDSVQFKGDFKATNASTGELFRSDVCYLPDVAAGLLRNALDSSSGAPVEFGFAISVIGVKGRKDGEPNKYEYRCKPLMKAAENDPMLALEQRLQAEAEEQHGSKTITKKKGG